MESLFVLKLVSYEVIGYFILYNVQKVIYEIVVDILSEFGFECNPSPHQNYKSEFVNTFKSRFSSSYKLPGSLLRIA